MKKDIKSMTPDELKNEFSEEGFQKFRSSQVFRWLHREGVSSFEEMTNIPKDMRRNFDEKYFIASCKIEDKYVSAIDGTVKYLFRLYDGEYVESVVMKYKYG